MGAFWTGTASLLVLLFSIPGTTYWFTLDGKPYSPKILSLNATPEAPAEGDVACIYGYWIVLGPPGCYRFRDTGKRLYRDGAVVALKSQRLLRNMTDEEIARLRGVKIEYWWQRGVERLAKVDPERVCITVQRGRPELPEGLRYLRLDGWEPETAAQRAWLRSFRSLRILAARRSRTRGADLADLPWAENLRVLHAPYATVTTTNRLRRLTGVRDLDLTAVKGLTEIGFAAVMPELRRLNVTMTEVTDLTPLSDHGSIREVDGSYSYVAKLPGGRLPKLRRMELLRGHNSRSPQDPPPPVDDAHAAAFRARNPECRLVHRWEQPFREALRGADRLRIVPHVHFKERRPGEVIEIEGKEEVARFVGRIRFNDRHSGWSCYCYGKELLVFYRGDVKLAVFDTPHAHRLDWRDGPWPEDGFLTEESKAFLAGWITPDR